MGAHLVLAINSYGSCFHRIGLQLAARLGPEHRVDIVPATRSPGWSCDLAVALCWRDARTVYARFPSRARALALYDSVGWPSPGVWRDLLRVEAARATVVIAGNLEILRALGEEDLGIPKEKLFLVEDGVDTTFFVPSRLPGSPLRGAVRRALWVGNSYSGAPDALGDMKGRRLAEEACSLAGVDLIAIDAAMGAQLPYQWMPGFYRNSSVFLCTARTEGTPNPLLEAMASGRYALTTNVGLVPRLAPTGGLRVLERTPKAFAAGLLETFSLQYEELQEFGTQARLTAERFDWGAKAPAWEVALRAALEAVGGVAPGAVPGPAVCPGHPSPLQVLRASVTSLAKTSSVVAGRLIASAGGLEELDLETLRALQGKVKRRFQHLLRGPTEPERRPVSLDSASLLAGGVPRLMPPTRRDTGHAKVAQLVCDRRGTAVERHLRGLAKHLPGSVRADVVYAETLSGVFWDNPASYDGVVIPYDLRLDLRGVVGGYGRTAGLLLDAKRAMRGQVRPSLGLFYEVNEFATMGVASTRLAALLSARCPRVVHLPPPVDTEPLPRGLRREGRAAASWWPQSGCSLVEATSDLRYLRDFVEPACEAAGVPLRASPGVLGLPGLLRLFQDSNVAIFLGTSGSCEEALAAMACGQVVVSVEQGVLADVKASQEWHLGVSGVRLVDGSLASLVEALRELASDEGLLAELALANMEEVRLRWSWEALAPRYAEFLGRVL